MTSPLSYPLQQLMTIKKTRFDQAVKTLEEKKVILEKAHEKLFDLTQEKDKALAHKTAKLTQLREALDQGTSTSKIQQMKLYLKTVDEDLASKQKKVNEQQKVVDAAQKQVDLATDDLFQKKKDLEKLEIHKGEWEKEVRYWTEQKEAVEHDDQSSAAHTVRKKEAKKRQT
jgi:flagellar biosynthesis chaperone FliJ